MSEHNLSSTPDKEDRDGGTQKQTRKSMKRSEKSVARYITVLFGAALLLLLLTFAMEWRQHRQMMDASQEQIDDLQQYSSSAYKRLDALIAENEKLKAELDRHQQEAREWSQQEDQLIERADQQNRALRAMDWFWQINEAYVQNKYVRCRQLIGSMEEADLAQYLPIESITDNGRFSPHDRYMEIRDRVME